MSQYVVWFDSSETGAPVLNNAAGRLIGVLDACLITGFNTKAVTITTKKKPKRPSTNNTTLYSHWSHHRYQQ